VSREHKSLNDIMVVDKEIFIQFYIQYLNLKQSNINVNARNQSIMINKIRNETRNTSIVHKYIGCPEVEVVTTECSAELVSYKVFN